MKLAVLTVTILEIVVLFWGPTSFASSEKFVSAYTDSNTGLSWSKALKHKYTNGCTNSDGTYNENKCTFLENQDGSRLIVVKDSYAAEACKAIGARLPSQIEYDGLIRNFDHIEETYGPRLSDLGIVEIQNAFGDMSNDRFWWSSTVDNPWDSHAYGFDPKVGITGRHDGFRFKQHAVRCVVN